MKYRYTRKYIAKLIDKKMTGLCGMSSVDSTTKQVLNLVCGDLIPLLYATKPTKVKKIEPLELMVGSNIYKGELLDDLGFSEDEIKRILLGLLDRVSENIVKINQLIDAVNSLLTNEKTI